MQLKIERFEFGETFTVGKMYIDNVYFCYTLEDKFRTGAKVNGQTAIPNGSYDVIVDLSTRFGKQLPHILNVPNFTGVRIHSGNTSKDTEGCILLGHTWAGKDFIGNSKLAVEAFIEKLNKAKKAKLEIVNV
jgi:hypothetical protein